MFAILLPTLLLAFSACTPLPRPFQPDKSAPPAAAGLAAPPSPETLAIAPVAGLLPETADQAAELLAAELRRYNLAAAAGPGNAGSLYLEGRLTRQGLLWLSSRADGTIQATETQILPPTRVRALAQGDPAMVETAMIEAARRLLPELSVAEASGLPGHPGARLVILPLDPAPEIAARHLRSAIRVALSGAALPLVEPGEEGPDDLKLQGSVRLGPDQSGIRRVEVIWELFDLEGRSLGRVSQGNLVESARLDEQWPETAPVIGQSAVEGIVDLLNRTGGAS